MRRVPGVVKNVFLRIGPEWVMRRLAVIHHRAQDWVPALQEACPDLDIRGSRPEAWTDLDQIGRAHV